MFRGFSQINLDTKGRMAMPSRYRDLLTNQFGGRLVATVDIALKCLLLYPMESWEEIQSDIAKLSSFDPSTRRVQQIMIGYATDMEMDGSGRVLLPQVLREYAQLDKQVALVGQDKKFEIWSQENWKAHSEKSFAAGGAEGELPAGLLNISL